MALQSDKRFHYKTIIPSSILFGLFVVGVGFTLFAAQQTQDLRGKAAPSDCPASAYDAAVLVDHPVAYWPLHDPDATLRDCSAGKAHMGTYAKSPQSTTLANGDAVKKFDGASQYGEIPDSDDLSVTKTGMLTVEAWMRPDVLQFPHQEDTGYVHWLGKGQFGQNEYVGRMYSKSNQEDRPNRISGYSFNLSGGWGTGSYFQDAVTPGEWIHFALVINTKGGYTKVFKNGVFRDQDNLSDYKIVPGNGKDPFRIGTVDFESYFPGAIGKVAVYDYEVPVARLKAHYDAISQKSLTTPTLPPGGVPSPNCLGACVTGTVTPPVTPSANRNIAPTNPTSPTILPTESAPTATPCDGTTSVQQKSSKHHNKGTGFLKRLLGFLTWFYHLLEHLLHGGTVPSPSPEPETPSPCSPTPTATEAPEPTNPGSLPTAVVTPSPVTSVVPTRGPTGTTTSSCALPNYPNQSCTGVPTGTSLTTVTGDVTLNTAGQVYEGKHVTGNIFVAAANVTIKKSQIDGNVVNHSNGDPKFTIEDSTVGKEGSCTKDTAIDESNYTATRVKVLGHGDGFGDSGVGNILIQDSFVLLCSSDASYHSDGVQGYLGGTNVVIRHNTIDQRPAAIGATAPIFMSDQSKDADVQDNLLLGGSETIRVYYAGGKDIVKNNRVVDKSWVYGPVSSSCSNITWSGNTLVTIDANYKITSTVGPLACAN